MSGNVDLTQFSRRCRDRIDPESLGLPERGAYRRVPGLRREEVAQLAGVSTDYYIRLEQGRNITPSDSVLHAVADALRLDDAERSTCRTSSRPSRAAARAAPHPACSAPAPALCGSWTPSPKPDDSPSHSPSDDRSSL
ncbi:helix-turn-helix transcriptional regulator [Streptomyces sp. JH34]|uniref:helix-turn-helix domain-containing protein n=1 Tax=Streptomyces sp. JH34 TaxID=2793633 RepID=UPI0023F691C1|nr:helix-turn-helix transcriptional regulator [Streptomyces sp. JH34]MDF6016998.1 helix-turn-helix domain-containing protein [Streptomyces sp. JH34]